MRSGRDLNRCDDCRLQSLRHGRLRLRSALVRLLAVGLLVALGGAASLGQATSSGVGASGSGGKTAKTSVVRVVGPRAAQELMGKLATEFSKGHEMISLDYQDQESPGTAVTAFVGGRDLLLTLGKLSPQATGAAAQKWKTLDPQEHVLGARVVAVVVHKRNPADSLTLEQLQSVFSGKIKDWKALGGEVKAIHCYGLMTSDPLATMFHQKVLPVSRCVPILRKTTSAEVLSVLAGDPDGIAFADAAALAAAGDTVKLVALGEGSAAVLPNAQTIKDGSYNLAQVLALYSLPKPTTAAAQGFVDYVLSDEPDALCRQCGFLPTVRLAQADVLAFVNRLYGADLKRVRSASDPHGALALADQMLEATRTTKLPPEVAAQMCRTVYDLGSQTAGGDWEALASLRLMAERVPDKCFEAATCHVALCERDYNRDKNEAHGQYLLEKLLLAADTGTSARRFVEAAELWRKAIALAEQLQAPDLADMKERLPAFEARVVSVQEWERLRGQLRENPQDAELHSKVIRFCVVELNNPAEALKLVDKSTEEVLKVNLPLALQPEEKLSEESAQKLAEWYVELAGQAGLGGRELMNRQAQNYYLRFFKLHPSRDDTLATQAILAMKKVGGATPDQQPVSTPPRGPLTNLRLAEYVHDQPWQYYFDNISFVTDLSCVARLTNARQLGFLHASRIKDLSPLANLLQLESLNLGEAGQVADLGPLGKLSRLTQLWLPDCTGVHDLTPLLSLKNLSNLGLTNCTGVKDFSVLAKLTKLKALCLTGCKLTDADIEALAKALPNCVITSESSE